jgi:hypothetical protein
VLGTGADSLVHQQGQQLRDWLLQWKQRSAPLAVLDTPPARLPQLIASLGSPAAESPASVAGCSSLVCDAVLVALVAGGRRGCTVELAGLSLA